MCEALGYEHVLCPGGGGGGGSANDALRRATGGSVRLVLPQALQAHVAVEIAEQLRDSRLKDGANKVMLTNCEGRYGNCMGSAVVPANSVVFFFFFSTKSTLRCEMLM